ncbi:MAG: type II toxin-antitoxin system PemK/MazF family toxin [Candidatus Nanoarchaeia archaeon]|nr:type II toxin-antitoxin system PemK/MazF family toxin [Candidatus Nanoarchaeia archaeon]
MEQIPKEKIMQKDVVILPFPFTDSGSYKVRPAIVVSNEYFNTAKEDCILVPLTSVIKDDAFSIAISQDNMAEGELLKESRIRADKIFSIDKETIITRIGSIDDKIFNALKEKILSLF